MKIVLWTLGSFEHQIYPSKEAIEKIQSQIDNLSEDKVNHIVWGPELTATLIDTNQNRVRVITKAETIKELKELKPIEEEV